MNSISYPPCFKYLLENMKETDDHAKAVFLLSFLQYLSETGVTDPQTVRKKIAALPLLAQFSTIKRERPLNFLIMQDKTYTIDSTGELEDFRLILCRYAKSGQGFPEMMKKYDKKLTVCHVCPYSADYSLTYHKEETALCKMVLDDFSCFKKISGLNPGTLFTSYISLADIFPTVRSSVYFPGMYCLIQAVCLNADSYWNSGFFGKDYTCVKKSFREQLKTFGITPAKCTDDPDYDKKIFSCLMEMIENSGTGESFDSLLDTLLNRKKYIPDFHIDKAPRIPRQERKTPSGKQKHEDQSFQNKPAAGTDAPVSVQTGLMNRFVETGKATDAAVKDPQTVRKQEAAGHEGLLLEDTKNPENTEKKTCQSIGVKTGDSLDDRIDDSLDDRIDDGTDTPQGKNMPLRPETAATALPMPVCRETVPEKTIPFDLSAIHMDATAVSGIRIMDTPAECDRLVSRMQKEGFCILEPLSTEKGGTDYLMAGCGDYIRLVPFDNHCADMLLHRKEIRFASARTEALYDMCIMHGVQLRDIILPLFYAADRLCLQIPDAEGPAQLMEAETGLCRMIPEDAALAMERRFSYACGYSLYRNRICPCEEGKSPILTYDREMGKILFTPYDYDCTGYLKQGLLLTYTIDRKTETGRTGSLPLVKDIVCSMVEKGMFRNLDIRIMEIRDTGLTLYTAQPCFEYVYTMLSTLFFEKGAVRGMDDLLFYIDIREAV